MRSEVSQVYLDHFEWRTCGILITEMGYGHR